MLGCVNRWWKFFCSEFFYFNTSNNTRVEASNFRFNIYFDFLIERHKCGVIGFKNPSNIYYEDDGLFKAIIGITENYDNISKIQSTYKGESIVSEYYSDNEELNKKIKEFDKKIDKSDDVNEIKNIVLEMINLYKDNDDNTLIKIS